MMVRMSTIPGWMITLACHDGSATVAIHGDPDPAVSSALIAAIQDAVVLTGSARSVEVAFADVDGASENVFAGLAAMAHDAAALLAREMGNAPRGEPATPDAVSRPCVRAAARAPRRRSRS
jgi:hypothetical protein